jgi:hypothetical protein
MSINNQEEKINLQTNLTDYTTSILKSVFGLIPIVGPVAQELLGIIIPRQRMDRVVKFVELLSEDFNKIRVDFDSFLSKVSDARYSTLFYKACVGSADAYSEERIKYIKNIFVYGLEQKDMQVYKAEGLLNLLNKVTDIEIVYLRCYYLYKWDLQGFKEYQAKTGLYILQPNIHGGMSREEIDDEVAKSIYLRNLVSYGLLEIELDIRGKSKYKCSSVGDLLIRTIDSVW